MQNKLIKGGLTVLGAVILTTLGVFASDSLRDGQMAGVGNTGACLEGSLPVVHDGKTLCVDVYEVSPSPECPNQVLTNVTQSEENASRAGCKAVSVPSVAPWNYVTLPQAQRLCANSGKRLPTNDEWYHIALGTNIDTCTIRGQAVQKTGSADCISSTGAHDMIGNVWEWVDEEVIGNTFNGRPLPEEGYVTSVDAQGVAVTSAKQADDMYGKDYIWTKTEGVFGMIRGGFYGSNDDAGLYTMNASVPTGFATQGVGFRCVKDTF